MSTQYLVYDFHGAYLTLIQQDGRRFVACRPVVDAIGLDWEGQYQRINRDEVLKSTICVVPTVTGNGRNHNHLCVPLERLSSWLSKISTSGINNPDVKARLVLYQWECYAALDQYFSLN